MGNTDVGRMSSSCKLSMALARGLAAVHGHADLTGTHVMNAVIREGRNVGVALLAEMGLDIISAEDELNHTVSLEPATLLGAERARVAIDVSPGEIQLLEEARKESDALGDPVLGGEHLVLAILHDSPSPAARMLARRGITYESARNALLSVIARNARSAGDTV